MQFTEYKMKQEREAHAFHDEPFTECLLFVNVALDLKSANTYYIANVKPFFSLSEGSNTYILKDRLKEYLQIYNS